MVLRIIEEGLKRDILVVHESRVGLSSMDDDIQCAEEEVLDRRKLAMESMGKEGQQFHQHRIELFRVSPIKATAV